MELWAERAAGAGALQRGWAGAGHRAQGWAPQHQPLPGLGPKLTLPACPCRQCACGPLTGEALGWKATPEGTLASGDPPDM